MTKHQILLKLFDLTERTKGIHHASVEIGREVIDVEQEITKLEVNLAQQADGLMADRYRAHNTPHAGLARTGPRGRRAAA
ncbi:MAG: hypothetical protein ABJC89_07335 [Acidobacteriota bacterium]